MTSQTPNAFFDQIREWSQRKHQALSDYLLPFAKIVARFPGPIHIVDGFAGNGFYGEGESREDGSPLRVAKLAASLVPIDVVCINVEQGRAEYANLCEATAPFGPKVVNLFGSFESHVDSILNRLGNTPAFFFIDPFGIGLTWNTVMKLGNRNPNVPTELLINFMAPAISREAGRVNESDPSALAFDMRLNSAMGNTRWQLIRDNAELGAQDKMRAYATLYCEGLANFGFMANAYPIREHLDGRLKYFLIHATRNKTGRRLMSDVFIGVHKRYILRQAEDERRNQTNRVLMHGQQPALDVFAPLLAPPTLEEIERPIVESLAKDILGLLRLRGPMTFEEIQDELITPWYGVVSGSHYRRACNLMRTRGQVGWEAKRNGLNASTTIEALNSN